jgi:hypothetical protein
VLPECRCGRLGALGEASNPETLTDDGDGHLLRDERRSLGYVALTDGSINVTGPGVGFELVAGVFAGAGAVAHYAGLDYGSSGVITTVSALYFVVAALLGVVVLGESFGLPNSWGCPSQSWLSRSSPAETRVHRAGDETARDVSQPGRPAVSEPRASRSGGT